LSGALLNEVQPGAGPPMHVHFKQEEGLTVVAGRLGYQLKGGPPRYDSASSFQLRTARTGQV
jgi:quercetin dioxygenase-like cupin family protein